MSLVCLVWWLWVIGGDRWRRLKVRVLLLQWLMVMMVAVLAVVMQVSSELQH